MAYKVLGQLAAAATTEEGLYAVPASSSTVVSSIVIANRGATAATYRLAVKPTAATTLATNHYLAYDVSIAANNTDNQWPTMTEVESHLTNRVNKLIDFNDYGKNDSYKNLSIQNKNVCNNKLVTEESRFTNPIEAYRCMDLSDYHYSPFMFVNPQCEFLEDRIGSNSRLNVKDNFVVTKPNLIDQSVFLPKETPANTDVCKNF
jgi:hypothetical protein